MALTLQQITEGMSGKRVREILNSNMQATAAEAAAVAAAEVAQVEQQLDDLASEVYGKVDKDNDESAIIKDTDKCDVYIDENGNILVRIGQIDSIGSGIQSFDYFDKDGNSIVTKISQLAEDNEELAESLEEALSSIAEKLSKNNDDSVILQDTDAMDAYIDQSGNVIAKIGHIDGVGDGVQASKFFDKEGNELAGGSVYEAQVVSLVKGSGIRKTAASLTDGQSIVLDQYPKGNNNGDCIAFYADVTTFDSLIIAKRNTDGTEGKWVEITTTNIGSEAHGLTISRFVSVNMKIEDGTCKVALKTLGGLKEVTIADWGYASKYSISVISSGSTLSNCVLVANNPLYKCPIWYFGASWEGFEDKRVLGQIKNLGYYNFMSNQWSGRTAVQLLADLKLALNYGTPKLLVAILANLSPTTQEAVYRNTFNELVELCNEKHIELVVRTHSNTQENNYDERNAWIRGQGIRIVDYYKAMHDDNKTWVSGMNRDADNYDGYIDSTNSHPSIIGAQSIAMRVLADVPEIMWL